MRAASQPPPGPGRGLLPGGHGPKVLSPAAAPGREPAGPLGLLRDVAGGENRALGRPLTERAWHPTLIGRAGKRACHGFRKR